MSKNDKIAKAKLAAERTKEDRALNNYKRDLWLDPNIFKKLADDIWKVDYEAKAKAYLSFIFHNSNVISQNHKHMISVKVKTPTAASNMSELKIMHQKYQKMLNLVNLDQHDNIADKRDEMFKFKRDNQVFLTKLDDLIFDTEKKMRDKFSEIEMLLNIMAFNIETFDTYSNSLSVVFSKGFLNVEEYNILKAFNTIRNLMVHNSSVDSLYIVVNELDLTLCKAVIIEANNIFNDLIKKHIFDFMYYAIIMEFKIFGYESTPDNFYEGRIERLLNYFKKDDIKLLITEDEFKRLILKHGGIEL